MTLRPYSATLQKTFRDTLETPGAPEVIDDGNAVTPVVVVGGSLNVSVTTDNSPPQLSSNQTFVAKTSRFNAAANTSYDMYTPTSGKTLRIIAMGIATDTTGDIRIGDNISAAFAVGTIYDGIGGRFIANTPSVMPLQLMPVVTKLNMHVITASVVTWWFIGYEETT